MMISLTFPTFLKFSKIACLLKVSELSKRSSNSPPYLKEELKNWSYLNLVGDEIFAAQIVGDALVRPFQELFANTNTSQYKILQEINQLGYPFGYNLIEKKITQTIENGLVDSSKSVRAILWNALTIVSTIITSD